VTGCPSNWISGKDKDGAILLDCGRVATDSRTDKNSLVPFPQISVDCAQQCFGWDLSRYKSGVSSRTHCSNDPAEDFQVEELRASLNLLVPMTGKVSFTEASRSGLLLSSIRTTGLHPCAVFGICG
jgi:hypothetical protein